MINAKLALRISMAATVALGLATALRAVASDTNSKAPPAARAESWDKSSRLKQLTPMQFHVTQENGTEPPFRNEYWNNHRDGIYVDIVSGEPLFLSKDKYESGTGWPSFTQPVEPGNVVTKTDSSLFETRVEVRSARADSHLGHVFDDGPAPTGKRYCMNSAAMRFIPLDQMAAAGYVQYLPLLGHNSRDPRR